MINKIKREREKKKSTGGGRTDGLSAHERKPESPLVVGTCKTRRSLISSGSAQRNTVILSVTHLNRASLITHYCYKHTFRVCAKCVHTKILVNVQKGDRRMMDAEL